jgi:hypothetical protein
MGPLGLGPASCVSWFTSEVKALELAIVKD